jgi:hypothetical protein
MGKREFHFDGERRADIVDSLVWLELRPKNLLMVGESTSFHAW